MRTKFDSHDAARQMQRFESHVCRTLPVRTRSVKVAAAVCAVTCGGYPALKNQKSDQTVELPRIDFGAKGLVSPPSDTEVYAYLGRRQLSVQVCTTVAFALTGVSLFQFSMKSVWLRPFLVVLAVNLTGTVLSALTGWNRGRIDESSHRRTVSEWLATKSVSPSVDLFLPTCGENLDVLRNTYRHVSAMHWAGIWNVYVLDDAARPEVKRTARAFGFHYMTRPNRGHLKKAGNLQYAYQNTGGEFIVILDADFCPRQDFLYHLMPYTSDPAVGIVQSPQYFSTTKSMGWLERTAGATQELFYRWVQPSRDIVDASICVGTSAVYRRAALDAAGGFPGIDHSEDVYTGIFMLRAGFRTKYVPILVSRGLCPSDLVGFVNQQYRWCNGSMALLASGKVLGKPLTLRQRLSFWAGFMYYISTAVNVFSLHLPGIVMLVFYPGDIRSAHFVPFLAGAWVYFVLLPRVSISRWRFEAVRIQLAYSFCHALAIIHQVTGRTQGWVATGAAGKGSSLTRTICWMGSVTLAAGLAFSWPVWCYDVQRHGLREFWAMGLFLIAQTYLAVPLLVEFLRVLGILEPAAVKMARRGGDPVESDQDSEVTNNPITIYEAIGYTAVIGFVALFATGYYDLFLPWG